MLASLRRRLPKYPALLVTAMYAFFGAVFLFWSISSDSKFLAVWAGASFGIALESWIDKRSWAKSIAAGRMEALRTVENQIYQIHAQALERAVAERPGVGAHLVIHIGKDMPMPDGPPTAPGKLN